MANISITPKNLLIFHRNPFLPALPTITDLPSVTVPFRFLEFYVTAVIQCSLFKIVLAWLLSLHVIISRFNISGSLISVMHSY